MSDLEPRHYVAIDRCLRALYACTDSGRLPGVIIEQARALVGACHTSFNVLAPRVPRAEVWMDGGEDPAALQALFAQHLHEHPAIVHYLLSGDASTHKISDFCSARAFHHTGIFQRLYRRLGIEDQMGFCLGPPGPQMQALALGRESRSFIETDRALLEAIRPHVAQAWRNAGAFERLQRALDMAERPRVPPGLGLTARELEVLAALAQGGRNADIAAALAISPQTVRTHLEHIYDKLGVHSRTAALACLRRWREGGAAG